VVYVSSKCEKTTGFGTLSWRKDTTWET